MADSTAAREVLERRTVRRLVRHAVARQVERHRIEPLDREPRQHRIELRR
jgi:hypothetical protein